jgi:hypothetical protein
MRKLWLALLFFAGGVSHEIRNPFSCHCITARQAFESLGRGRKQSGRAAGGLEQ